MSRIAHTLNIIIVSITGTPIGFIMELEPGVMDLLRLPQPLTCLTRHARQPTTGKASLCLEISRDYHSCHCIAWSQIGGKPCSLQGTYGVASTIGILVSQDRESNGIVYGSTDHPRTQAPRTDFTTLPVFPAQCSRFVEDGPSSSGLECSVPSTVQFSLVASTK